MNERVLKVDKNLWLNLITSAPDDNDFKEWSSQNISVWIMKNVHYIYVPRKNIDHEYTLWIVVDLELHSGRKLLNETLHYLVKIFLYFVIRQNRSQSNRKAIYFRESKKR